MGLFKRIKNIIKSNVKHEQEPEIDINSYEDLYFEDSKELPEDDTEREYYANLELEYGADFDRIKSSYRRLLKKYHPDFYQNDAKKQETAIKITKKINEAYLYFERKYL